MPAISPFLLPQAGRRERGLALVELTDRGIDVVPPIGCQVGPGQACIIVEHHRRGLGQIGQYRLHSAGAEPMVAGQDHQPRVQRRQAARVQYGRAHQGQRRNALRIFGDETLDVGQTAAGKMRPGDAEMIQKLREACLDRRVPDGTDDSCDGRSPYFGIGTNNARLAFGTAVARFIQVRPVARCLRVSSTSILRHRTNTLQFCVPSSSCTARRSPVLV